MTEVATRFVDDKEPKGRQKNRRTNGKAESDLRSESSHNVNQGSSVVDDALNGTLANPRPEQEQTNTSDSEASRQGRPARRRRPRRPKTRIVTEHSFGGTLTPTTLDPKASNFEPSASSQEPAINQVRMTKSRRQRPPLDCQRDDSTHGQQIQYDIARGTLECMICCDNVKRFHRIWYCQRCFAVFHLGCVKKWSRQSEQMNRAWRCPGCQHPQAELPTRYTCWCGKAENPETNNYLPPHSCGESCGKSRSCEHPCQGQCHAGPCPPCGAMGSIMDCFCGKHSRQKRCIESDSKVGWSCQEVCGELMSCGKHTCQRLCHAGLCGTCTAMDTCRCYCGKETKEMFCGDKIPMRDSRVSMPDASVQVWSGYFRCLHLCERPFDCGRHTCQRDCHPQDPKPAHCTFSPDVVGTCHCRKTALRDLGCERANCEAPIPVCSKTCEMPRACGHACQRKCHAGPCGPCPESVTARCRCGQTIVNLSCRDEIDTSICDKRCRAMLSCNRHKCQQVCCPGDKVAHQRAVATKKKRIYIPVEEIETEHICTQLCGRLLKCGKHHCSNLCHAGPCPSCLEATFEDLTCHCGKTRLLSPIPCSTKPPTCSFPCERPTTCGHPKVEHTCHGDDVECTKCPYLVERTCMCGKKTIRAQPCWRSDANCGQPCSQLVSCGAHRCRKICHKPGECDNPCAQPCGKARRSCGHSCNKPCHSPYECPESEPCEQHVELTCACGHMKQMAKCTATAANPDAGKRTLKCSDQCALLERNRKMAEALEIDALHTTKKPQLYTDTVLEFYAANPKWAVPVEKTMRNFCDSPANIKRYAFPPMNRPQRGFVHGLAEAFGIDSQAQDAEPYRNIVIFKTVRMIAPSESLGEALARRNERSGIAPARMPGQLRRKGQALNAIVLSGLRHGILHTEVESFIAQASKASVLHFTIKWYGDEKVLLLPDAGSLTMYEVETELRSQHSMLKKFLVSDSIADHSCLCWVERSGVIAYKEGEQRMKPKEVTAWRTPNVSVKNAFDVLE